MVENFTQCADRDFQLVERGLAGLVERHKLPGMIGAVVKGARIAAFGATGLRKLGFEEPIRFGDRVQCVCNGIETARCESLPGQSGAP